MESIHYDNLQETLYYEVMDNGLHVYVLPKPGFQKTYATFATKYGSVDNHFKVEGESETQVPDGIAHFLEHKMFEEPEGDIFAKFASNGASANAFTSFDQTVYLFSATENIHENLETLIDFVQNPYFTDQNVEKEKGIIGQEINMYQDNPDWRVYFGLIEAMYKVHPVHIDIAGTVESIGTITKEDLYTCYNAFYHPSNMLLFVVGGVDPEETMNLVRSNQAGKSYDKQGSIERIFDPEPQGVEEKRRESRLAVSLPKCLFGFKEKQVGLPAEEQLHRDLTTKLMMDLLFGSSTELYQKLYDEDLISDSFGHEYNSAPQYAFSAVGGDTKDPDQLLARIRTEVDKLKASGFQKSDFERARKKKMGGYLRMLNSPENIAHEFTRYQFRGADLFKVLPVYESITVDDVNRRLQEHVDWDQLAVSIVVSP
ncbi:peptidase M16 domain protein [Paenibacillus vortex V453]|uniref:Zinc protease n=2 Tax=Paenibacillus TaxID=44249 RepID=A0A163E8Z4_9BACL|nr:MULTISPECIES: pitrilysin family protein [Paenibacillus]ANA83107.1 zinc protease [Paenibacillus glucanolyticus]AVV57803.1 insulinase family protein [Paenibacillus glucanolyticus]EFU40059.1 peptidase M16 domain protein [Paenibacillus vortex V453]ETT34584.1 peptidase M16 domain-containing protein [Paenibacillus sp. FSL R5-808]KZS43682.1 zinc protease [Paenibacillus glucanolyticus]